MKKKSYLEVNFERLPRSLEPGLASWLFRHGCWGTHERLDFNQSDLNYEPQIMDKKFISVSAYFDSNVRQDVEGPLLTWIKQRSPLTTVRWSLKRSKDWLREWKKNFKPFQIAGLKIVPSWRAPRDLKNLKQTIIIEPGMAFGTGTHPTTQFAMEMIAYLGEKLSQARVLDVGAGSGILSVTAERYGAKSVLAVDNDPESWRECKKTFQLNRASRCQVTTKQISGISSQFDLVVANIIDGVLMDLKEQLWRKTKRGGHIILSGILAAGGSAFQRDFLNGKKAKILRCLQDSEWMSFLILK